MSEKPSTFLWHRMIGLLLLCILSGCAHSVESKRQKAVLLGNHLAGLSPAVNQDEARRVAVCAFDRSQQLAQEYRVARPPLLHNFLVNLGFKNRGLCHHWAEDLLVKLQELRLETLELHWGIARAGTLREHNCVVITAHNQIFEHGIVLDAWRHSGNLYWAQVAADRYPWQEAEMDPAP